MAKKKRTKAFRAVTAVKALARERIGAPPAERIVQDRKRQQKGKKKHKPTFGDLLQADDQPT